MAGIDILAIGLPEDILKAKWAGDFAFACSLIDARLAGEISPALAERLLLERERLKRLPTQYTLSREDALREMQRLVPDFTRAELDALDLEGATEYLYVQGERMYFYDFQWTLLKMKPELGKRAGRETPKNDLYSDWIRELKKKGVSGRRLRLRAELRVTDEAFRPGERYTVHLPIPAQAAQVSDIRLLSFSREPFCVAGADACQRTACFREAMPENTPFFVEYEYVNTLRYFDADTPPEKGVLYPAASAPLPDDLSEQLPHVRFSPYLRALEKELRGDGRNPLAVARRYYDYITKNVRYSYLRAYLQLDDLAEYTALSQKGDCGAQALLFIALCRIGGIPARWQSGLCAEPGDPGCHDWAQFYTEDYGWLFADCSFGGGGLRRGDEERRRFYFGNLDPYRMVANSVYQADFDPPKRFLRKDPFDNQKGECETDTRALRADEVRSGFEVLSCEEI